jgi:hypothetical protein
MTDIETFGSEYRAYKRARGVDEGWPQAWFRAGESNRPIRDWTPAEADEMARVRAEHSLRIAKMLYTLRVVPEMRELDGTPGGVIEARDNVDYDPLEPAWVD